MKNSTFMRAVSIFVPLAVYLGISRYITYRIELNDFDTKSGNYFKHYTMRGYAQDKYDAPTYLNVDTGFMNWFFGHVFGLVACLILAFIIAGVVLAIKYVFNGPGESEYVDPRKNPKCPCQRHVVERQQAADASSLAMGVAVGTTVGISISSM